MANIRKSFNFRNGVQVDNDNFVVNANGLVGIGTSVPQNYLLNVFGDARTTGLTTTRDLFVSQNAEVSGVTTVGVLTASSIDIENGVNVGGALTAATLKLTNGETVDNLIGFARTTFITDNSGVGLHTTSKIGINTTTSPGASDSELSVTGNVNVTGIVTANTFSGDLTGNVNATSGVSTFTELKVGTAITMSAGIVTATTFEGNLTGNVTGTATTASNLSNATGITTGTINDDRLPDVITSNINILTGTSYFNQIGVVTTIPQSDIHVRKNSQAEIQVTSDSNASLIGLGRTNSITGFNGVLRYGNTDPAFSQFSGFGITSYSLDMMNYGPGNINFYLNPSEIAGTTGGFFWHKESQRLMALTSAGNLGVGLTNPSFKLQVNGTARVSGNAEFGADLGITNNLICSGNIGINSTSPTQKLDVGGNIAATGNIVSVGNITAASFSGSLATADLTGSITNAQLAGSISNDKLAGSIADNKLASTFLKNVVDDTTPQLGGNLDINNSNITGGGGVDISGITTSGDGFTSGIGGPVEISVVGTTLTFTVVGVGSTSLTLA